MGKHWLVVGLLFACERDDVAVVPEVTVAPASDLVQAPAVAPVAAANPPATVPAAAPVVTPARPRARAAAPEPVGPLPSPPADARDTTDAYRAWLAGLSRGDQRRITRYCTTEAPVEYDERCGGIGPLHIPVPPSMAAMPVTDHAGEPRPTRDDWYAALTAKQRAYITDQCAGGESNPKIWSQLCGACPLVIAFDAQRVAFAADGGRFEFRAGDAVATDWPTAATPWLALDRDGDGVIARGDELFGNASAFETGFAALAALDANGDGRIDRADPAFARLVLWSDRDGDRRGAGDELVAVASAGIDSIELAVTDAPRCDARGNCERERAAVHWHDATGGAHVGAVVDVYLHYQD
jgi:hypothetical protein|nr:hypothetical protein [Kofleriaceae bacterium]